MNRSISNNVEYTLEIDFKKYYFVLTFFAGLCNTFSYSL